MQKQVRSVHQAHAPHMVGDGLPVRNVFSYNDLGKSELSPFLLLDYGSPSQFPPTEKSLGVGMHPHRGFETVTIAFQGRLAHRDTAGNHGEIGPGDVQWMTAGSGVLHEELHAPAFRKSGGTLQMLQLWVNLPAQHKMTSPKYQTILNEQIPVLEQDEHKIRIIAGSIGDINGPAITFTPINLWDIELRPGANLPLKVIDGYTTAIFIMEGTVSVNDQEANSTNLVVLERQETDIVLQSEIAARVIVLNGKPINEPVIGYGPFVMNTQEQIQQAFDDFQHGRMGRHTI